MHQYLFVDCLVTRFYYLNWLYGCQILSFVLEFLINSRNFKNILSLFQNDQCFSLKRYILYFYNNDKLKKLNRKKKSLLKKTVDKFHDQLAQKDK